MAHVHTRNKRILYKVMVDFLFLSKRIFFKENKNKYRFIIIVVVVTIISNSDTFQI